MSSKASDNKKVRTILVVAILSVGIAGMIVSLWSDAVRGTLSLDNLSILLIISFGVIGSLIIFRHARHPVGWIFLAMFGYVGVDSIAEVSVWLITDRFPEASSRYEITFRLIEAYRGSISVSIWMALLIFPALYFPNGKLASRRWRYPVRVVMGLLVVEILNPQLSSAWFDDEQTFTVPVLEAIATTTESLLVLAAVYAPASLIVRFRRAQGIERQQIKWPLFSALLATIGIGGLGTFSVLNSAFEITAGEDVELIARAGSILEAISVLTFPFTIAIGILRYRLYDIDLLINRTLVYGTLTTLLALAYYVSVLLAQQILPAESPVAIVLSTLATVVLFSPLRRRIQGLIDKRFYRQRYDARQAVTRFSEELRDDIELDQISKRLLGVIDETVRPEHASLWIRPVERENG